MDPTDRDAACFEAGIKLGAVYHQFIGTPVRPDTAATLSDAMANAMTAQPTCQSATVNIDTEAVESDLNRFGYVGLKGDHLTIEVVVEHEDHRVSAELIEEDGYPFMQLVDVSD